MGADFGDYDNDGWLDLIVTSYAGEMTLLYQNLKGEMFNEVARQTGVGAVSLPHVTWGIGFVDFDNDGYRDMYMALGDLDEFVARRNNATAYELPNLLLRNNGQGRFIDVSRQSGDGMRVAAAVAEQHSTISMAMVASTWSCRTRGGHHRPPQRVTHTESLAGRAADRNPVQPGRRGSPCQSHRERSGVDLGSSQWPWLPKPFRSATALRAGKNRPSGPGGSGLDRRRRRCFDNVTVDGCITIRQGTGLIGGSPEMAR